MSLKDFSISSKLGTFYIKLRIRSLLNSIQSLTSKRPSNLRPKKSKTSQFVLKINIKRVERSSYPCFYKKQSYYWLQGGFHTIEKLMVHNILSFIVSSCNTLTMATCTKKF